VVVRALSLMIVFVFAAGPASAGAVRGVIWPTAAEAHRAAAARAAQPARPSGLWAWLTQPPTPPPPATAPAPKHKGPTMPPLRPQPALREAVVWLDTVPDKVERGLDSRWRNDIGRRNPRIVQIDLHFTPRVSAVAAGTSVEFQNLDRVWHNVFSVSRASRFDLGKCPPGRIDTVRFASPGLVNLHCDIHPEETAFVMVVPNHAYVRPDSLGRFALPKLPAGHYQLRLWHPRLGERTHAFDMPKHGDVELDLSF